MSILSATNSLHLQKLRKTWERKKRFQPTLWGSKNLFFKDHTDSDLFLYTINTSTNFNTFHPPSSQRLSASWVVPPAQVPGHSIWHFMPVMPLCCLNIFQCLNRSPRLNHCSPVEFLCSYCRLFYLCWCCVNLCHDFSNFPASSSSSGASSWPLAWSSFSFRASSLLLRTSARYLSWCQTPRLAIVCTSIGRKHIVKRSGCQMRMMLQFSSFFFFPLLSSLLTIRSHTTVQAMHGRYTEDITSLRLSIVVATQ